MSDSLLSTFENWLETNEFSTHHTDRIGRYYLQWSNQEVRVFTEHPVDEWELELGMTYPSEDSARKKYADLCSGIGQIRKFLRRV